MLAGKGRSVSVPCCAPHPIFTARKMGAGGVVWGVLITRSREKIIPQGQRGNALLRLSLFSPSLLPDNYIPLLGGEPQPTNSPVRPEKIYKASASGHTLNVKLSTALLFCINTMLEPYVLIESAWGIHQFCLTYIDFMQINSC